MRKVNSKRIIIFLAVVGLLIFLHFTRLIFPLENLLIKVLRPAMGGVYHSSSKIRTAYNQQTDKRDLASVAEQLKSEVNKLKEENARLKVLEEENNSLRSYLKFLKTSQSRYLMANVVSKGEIDTSDQTVVIDKGSKDGLFPGLAVISSDGNIVGKVLETQDNLSNICLVTSSRCQLASTIQNKDKTIGVSQGDLGLTVKMNYIPQNEEVKVGDIVVSSGLEKNIPRGLVIGQINQVTKENNELWQSARIEPLSDFNDLIIVSVLMP